MNYRLISPYDGTIWGGEFTMHGGYTYANLAHSQWIQGSPVPAAQVQASPWSITFIASDMEAFCSVSVRGLVSHRVRGCVRACLVLKGW
jgi:hypothetical protein